MVATVPDQVASKASPVRSFLALRRCRQVLGVMLILGMMAAWLGQHEAMLPSMITQERAVIPMWRLLAMGAAVVPAMSLHTRLSDLEVVATLTLRRCERAYLAGIGVGCAAIYLGISAITLPPAVLLIIARSWSAWLGLALLAGVVLGWRLAWTLPTFVAVILWFWGMRGGGRYHWWEFSARPYDDVASLVFSLGLLAIGMAAYWATPWRRRRWISRFRFTLRPSP